MLKNWHHLGVLSTFSLVLLLISFYGGISGQGAQPKDDDTSYSDRISERVEEVLPEKEVETAVEVEEVHDVPEAINGLLIGFDRTNGLTDVIMVAHIDPATGSVDIISIPRDLEIYFTEEALAPIKASNPKNRILHAKLNNIYSLIGWDEQALKDIRSVVEVITGLEMDYMMTVNIDGFKDMVDAVGGVEFYVPQDMYYNDPVQDLYIDLDEGLQILDGDKAEQLVRYRKGYARGDLQRIEVQQAFVAAMVDQVIHQSDFNEIQQLLATGYDMINADFGLVVMLDYAEFFFDLDLEHILTEENMMTIPSWGEKVDGTWYQYFDLEEAQNSVKALINGEEETENGR